MSLLSCVCYKSYFFILIYWIIEISVSLIKNIKEDSFELKNIDYENQFIDIISLNIADLLAGFLVLYSYCQFKNKTENKIRQSKFPLIYNNPLNKNKKKIFYLLILVCFLDLYSRSVYFIHSIISKKKGFKRYQMDWLVGLDIIIRYIFSLIILKTKMTKHHIFSIIITIIGYSINSIIDSFVVGIGGIKDIIIYSLFILPRAIFFPLEDVVNQILLSEDYLMPHILMFYRGIFTAILFILLIPILILIKNHTKEDYFSLRHKEKQVNEFFQLFLVFTYIVFYSFRNFSIMKVIYFFSPQHVSFLIEVFYIFILLRCRIRAHDIKIVIITDLICLFIIVSSTLIFNEMVIINACGMNKHTKKSLILKESQEIKDINLSINYEQNDNNENSLETSKSFEKSTECDF